MNLGLTGGIACGKSTVAAMLLRRGAVLIDADAIAREMVFPGSPPLAGIVQRFGPDMLMPDGTLNRKKLGSLVFRDEVSRRDLEGILHPPIRRTIRERMGQVERETPDKLAVVDVPLLYETGMEDLFNRVMVVYVPRSVQLDRLMKRDGLSVEAAEQRLQAQMPIEEKRKRADFVIDNSGDLAETERQIDLFWSRKGKA